MKKVRKFLAVITIFAVFLSNCIFFNTTNVQAYSNSKKVVTKKTTTKKTSKHVIQNIDILSINAFHGNLESDAQTVGAAKLASYINYYKSKNPKGTVLLDAGNALSGTSLSANTYGKSVVDFENQLNFDAMALGNHDFDWGIEKLTNTMKYSKHPLLCGNIYKNNKRITFAKPYTIINKNGVKIGIIGLINPKHKDAITQSVVEGLDFRDAVKESQKLIPEVKSKGAQVVVLLVNIGGTTDPKTNIASGDLIDFAKKVKGANAIVGCLQDTVCTVINNTPVVEAFRYGEKIGHINLSYDATAKKVLKNKVSLIDVKSNSLKLSPDKKITALVALYSKDLAKFNSTVIGTCTKDLIRHAGESEIGNWFADSIKEEAKTQIAFTNPGGIRSNISAGPITNNIVFTVMPFPNTICKGTMTGSQIKTLFERCAETSVIPISGVKFTYNRNNPVGSRVTSIKLSDGTPVEMDKQYTAATNNFLAGGKDGYTSLAEIKWSDTNVLVRDALTNYINKYKTLNPQIEGRIVDVTP